MKLIIILLIILVCVLLLRPYTEGFTPYGPYQIGGEYQNALGSAPAGINALSGELQYQQNSNATSVNRVKPGNSQNTYPEYKQQP
jgi:hypothetical protein